MSTTDPGNRQILAPLQCAVSLEWLSSSFLRQHPEVAREGLTTAQVVMRIVKPTTEGSKCRYVALLQAPPDPDLDPDPEVRSGGAPALTGTLASAASPDEAVVSGGRAFYFISHGWARPFMELVAMVQRHFSPEQQQVWRPAGQPALAWGEVFIWLDIFAINQHPGDCQRNDLQVRILA